MKVGDIVRLRYPKMTKMKNTPLSDMGRIVSIDGAYVSVRPVYWPENAHIEFLINEVEEIKRRA
jgi:hypothetical protein